MKWFQWVLNCYLNISLSLPTSVPTVNGCVHNIVNKFDIFMTKGKQKKWNYKWFIELENRIDKILKPNSNPNPMAFWETKISSSGKIP
jgi:hypothetical protein